MSLVAVKERLDRQSTMISPDCNRIAIDKLRKRPTGFCSQRHFKRFPVARDSKFQERYDSPSARFQAARCLLEILKTLLMRGVGQNREERDEIGHIVRTRDADAFNQTEFPIISSGQRFG